MYCNSLNLHSEYFWLFLSALGMGFALAAVVGSLLVRLRGLQRFLGADSSGSRKPPGGRHSPLVRIALSLTLAFASVLGALIFVDLSGVEWVIFHFYFFLTVTGVAGVLRLFLRYLAVPFAVVVLAYVFFVSALCREWIPAIPGQVLAEIKVLSVKEHPAGVEVSIPKQNIDRVQESDQVRGSYYLDGKNLTGRLRVIRFPRWTFYPGVEKLFILEELDGEPTETEAAGGDPGKPADREASGFLSLLSGFTERIGFISYERQEFRRTGVMPLQVYGLFYDGNKGDFSIRLLE